MVSGSLIQSIGSQPLLLNSEVAGL